jgi:murein DD-endopeptidase MepM/ murein hydrolase activator NlpD
MMDPLKTMIIRRAELDALITTTGVTSKLNPVASPVGGVFGKVRSSGHKMHTGWDLYAAVGTPCFAICGCEFVSTSVIGDYGTTLVVKLLDPAANMLAMKHGVPSIYAMYCHLSNVRVANASFMQGTILASTGNSGNATNTPPHLHFEVRKTPTPRKGDGSAIDPGELLGSRHLVSQADDVRRVKAIYGLK